MKPVRHLVIMAKFPQAGAVKTRLARQVGTAAAVRFARVNTAALLRRLGGDMRWRCWLAVAPDRAARARLWPGQPAVTGQGPGGLGARMQRLFDTMPPGPVILIGNDIPGIRPAHVAAAFRALERADMVFGPAVDGGFWLAGQKRRPRVLAPFTGIRWSTEHVLADVLDNLRGRSIAFAEPLADVDDEEGYRCWRRGESARERGFSTGISTDLSTVSPQPFSTDLSTAFPHVD
jgi:rSAM/selenodomain-associated transferase 1